MAQLITIIRKFADDTKLGQVIRSQADRDLLQQCLDKMTAWAKEWGMAFNISKCKVVHLGPKESVPYIHYVWNCSEHHHRRKGHWCDC